MIAARCLAWICVSLWFALAMVYAALAAVMVVTVLVIVVGLCWLVPCLRVMAGGRR